MVLLRRAGTGEKPSRVRQEQSTSRLGSWLLVLVVQRLSALLLLRPGGFLYDFSDYITYYHYARSLAEGFWPYRDFWMEYPPLFPLVNQAIYAVSLQFPPLPDSRFWHHLLLGLFLLPFDIGVVVLLHRLSRRLWGASRAEWTVAVWALLFAPLFLWQGYFDVLLLFGLLLALWAVVERRPVWAGVGLALGFLTKLLSLLVLPAALWAFAGRQGGWRRFFTRHNVTMVLVFAFGTLVVLLPLYVVGSEWLLVTFRNFGGRGAWQTIWALVDGYYGYGIVHGDRFDPNPTFAPSPSSIPWLWVHSLFAVGGLWLWLRRWRWDHAGVQVAFVAATLFLFLLWSKGWSPQFTLLILPFVLLLLPDYRGLLLSLLFTFLMAWEMIYFASLGSDRWMLVAIVVGRTALLALLFYVSWIRLTMWGRNDLVLGVEAVSGKS